MHPYIKGTLYTMIMSGLIFGLYAAFSYHLSCMDICIGTRVTISIFSALLGIVVGLVFGLVMALLSVIGLCKRIVHFTIAGAVVSAVAVLIVSAAMHTSYDLESLRAYDLSFGGLLGFAFGIAAAIQREKLENLQS